MISDLYKEEYPSQPSSYIGVIYDPRRRVVKAVFNPDYDEQLDDPQLTKATEKGEKLKMLKIHRVQDGYGVCPAVMSPRDCDIAIRVAYKILGWDD